MTDNVIRDSSGAITGIMQGGQVVSIDAVRNQSSLPPAAQTNVTLTPVTFSHNAEGNVVTKAVVPTVQQPTLTPVTFSHNAEGNVVTKEVTQPIQNTEEIVKTGQVSPGVVEIGKGMYGNLSTLKLASSGNGGIPITPGSVKVTEEITKQSEPSAVNLISNFGANVYNEVAGIVGLQKVNATAGFQEKISTISYEQKVSAPFISQNLRGYNSPDIVLNMKQSDVTTEKSLYADVGKKIGDSILKSVSIEDATYSTSTEAKVLSSLGGVPAAYAGLKSAYIGAYETVKNNPLDVVKYASEGVLLAGLIEGAGSAIGLVTEGTRLAPIVSTLAKYKAPEIALGATVGYGVATEVTAGFSDFSTSAAYGQISVPLASMGIGAGVYSMNPLLAKDTSIPSSMSRDIVKSEPTEFGSTRKTGELTAEQFRTLTLSEKETYNLYGTTTPISDIIAKQSFERRTESAIRAQTNVGGDILTRAYESSLKEPAVAPWEKEIDTFDLKTLNFGGSSEIKTSRVSETKQPSSASLAVARDLLSRVPEPSNTLPEPAIQSWERAELLKKLYPEEYGGSTSFGEIVVEPKNIFKFGGYSDSKPILESKLLERQKQPESTTVSRPTTLPYKDAINVEQLNKLLPKEKELNIPTESELQSASLRENIGKGYDWNKARKMGAVGKSTSSAPEVLLQLQSRVSSTSKARAYAEVSHYTSVASELELSAMNERSQRVGIASDARSSIDTKAIVMADLGASPFSKIETRTILDTEPMRETSLDTFPYPKIDIGTQRTTRDITITDTLPKIETVTTPKPYETTIFGGGGKIPPLFPGLPSPSGGGGAGGARDPSRKIQREILYIGPRSYGPKRTTKKRKK